MADFSDKKITNRRLAGKFKYGGLGWRRPQKEKEEPVFRKSDESDSEETKKKKRKKAKKKAKHEARYAERIAAEKAEAAYIEEQERLAREEEERKRAEAERIRLEEEKRVQEELEKQRQLEEEKRRIEEEKEAEKRRLAEEEERKRLEKEEEESEKSRLASEESERLRLEAEKREKSGFESESSTFDSDLLQATEADESLVTDTEDDPAFTEALLSGSALKLKQELERELHDLESSSSTQDLEEKARHLADEARQQKAAAKVERKKELEAQGLEPDSYSSTATDSDLLVQRKLEELQAAKDEKERRRKSLLQGLAGLSKAVGKDDTSESSSSLDQAKDLRRQQAEAEAEWAQRQEQKRLDHERRRSAGEDDVSTTESGSDSALQKIQALKLAAEQAELDKAARRQSKRESKKGWGDDSDDATARGVRALQKDLAEARRKRAEGKEQRRLERLAAGGDGEESPAGSSMEEIAGIEGKLQEAKIKLADEQKERELKLQALKRAAERAKLKQAAMRKYWGEVSDGTALGDVQALQKELAEVRRIRAAGKELRRLERLEEGGDGEESSAGSSMDEILDLEAKLKEAKIRLAKKQKADQEVEALKLKLEQAEEQRLAAKEARRRKREEAGEGYYESESGSSMNDVTTNQRDLEAAKARAKALEGDPDEVKKKLADLEVKALTVKLRKAEHERAEVKDKRRTERVHAGEDWYESESGSSQDVIAAIQRELNAAEGRAKSANERLRRNSKQRGSLRPGDLTGGDFSKMTAEINRLRHALAKAETTRAANKAKRRNERFKRTGKRTDSDDGSSLGEIEALERALADAEERLQKAMERQKKGGSSGSETSSEGRKSGQRRRRQDKFDYKLCGDGGLPGCVSGCVPGRVPGGVPGVWCLLPQDCDNECGPIDKELIPKVLLCTRNDEPCLLNQGLPDPRCCECPEEGPDHVACTIL